MNKKVRVYYIDDEGQEQIEDITVTGFAAISGCSAIREAIRCCYYVYGKDGARIKKDIYKTEIVD